MQKIMILYLCSMPQTSSKEDSSAAVWLQNKLASTTHLWSFSSTVATQYTIEKLQSIRECFPTLDSLVKIKFFLTLFYIPKRNIEEFRSIVQAIIDLTLSNCLDQWVLSIANFVNSYWQTQCLDTESDYEGLESFGESYTELIKAFEQCINTEDGYERAKHLFPIECDYLNKEARQSILPSLNFLLEEQPETDPSSLIGTIDSLTGQTKELKPVKHFNIIKTQKLNAQIEDLRNRAIKFQKTKTIRPQSILSDSYTDTSSLSNTTNKIPFINRYGSSTSKKLDSMTSQYSDTKASGSSFFKRSLTTGSTSTITGKSSIVKRDVGIKLLEVDEQNIFNPREAKRKRKEQEKESIKKVKQEDKETKMKVKEILKVEQEQKVEEKLEDRASETEEEDEDKKATEMILQPFKTNQSASLPTPQLSTFNDLFNPNLNSGLYVPNNYSQNLVPSVPFQYPGQQQNLSLTPTKMIDPNLILSHANESPQQLHQQLNQQLHQQMPQQINPFYSPHHQQQQQQQQQQQESPQEVKKQQNSLTLTREQMLQAQEMFSNSNKLTRPEKALILGFIAGSRENPRPDQGPLLLIKLNEAEEIIASPTGEQHQVICETYFQMNYETGEYKKIKKLKQIT